MTCKEIEALRIGLMNVLGVGDEADRRHAQEELGDADGPIEALAEADSLEEIERHLDAAVAALEEKVAATDESAAGYDYLRGRLVAVRDAERSVRSLGAHGETLYEGLGETHDSLHDIFPSDGDGG